jgi:alpha-D-ribose 1-methylphosphonate 5-triphosphate diphosphatase PhnM
MTRNAFLAEDNKATLALLLGQTTLVSADLASRINAISELGNDEGSVLLINKKLRGFLVELIDSLPDTSNGHEARRHIATHLRHRVSADPALQRPKKLNEEKQS